MSTENDALVTSLEEMRDLFKSGYFSDGNKWVDVVNRAIRKLTSGARRPRRSYRFCTRYGEIKALVADTPAGGTITVQNVNHANCIRTVARTMGRRIQMRQITPRQPERLVTLLD